MRDENFYAIGRCVQGEFHIASGDWGPAFCGRHLSIVDDHHRYTVELLWRLRVCGLCMLLSGELSSRAS